MLFLNPDPSMAEKMTALKSRPGSTVYIGNKGGAENSDNPAEEPDTKASEPPIRHSEFFFDDTLIAIQVENTLFNVHKYQLAKSEVFSEMFNMPKPEGDEPAEGSSPERPIVIHGAAASDFAALLKVLYASHFSSNPPAPEAPLVIPAFRLANRLNFSDLCAYLLPLAENKLEDVDRIVFAREFDIKDWLAPAHIGLCKREAPLNIREASKLGIESVLIISHMREKYRSQRATVVAGGYYCGNCVSVGTGYRGTCSYCKTGPVSLGHYNGDALVGSNTDTSDAALEAEVKAWVEDGFDVNREPAIE